jgi:hypothetical protein
VIINAIAWHCVLLVVLECIGDAQSHERKKKKDVSLSLIFSASTVNEYIV